MGEEQRRIVADYVGRLRRSMRGATADAIADVEREIRAHIEDALAARGSEPTVGDLLDVLERLGPPETYGRDAALYVMVEAGYHRWSPLHMVRSTAFWALSTVVGAVVVSIFGVLYGAGALMVLAGVIGGLGAGPVDRLVPPMLARTAPALVGLGGAALLAALTAVVRWFVGMYVHRARPHAWGGPEGGEGWADRTSRRILATAGVGLLATLAAGFAAGIYRPGEIGDVRRPPDYGASPLAAASGIALVILMLAPVLGVLWSVAVERRDDGRPVGGRGGRDARLPVDGRGRGRRGG